jgi:hypothetical protein
VINLQEIFAGLKTHFETEKTAAEGWLEQHLPGLADLADKAAANPLIDVALNAVHLSPEFLSALADTIRKADEELGAAKAAQAAAEASAAAAAQTAS